MYCSKCGGLVAEGATFCPACGQPMVAGQGAVAVPPPPGYAGGYAAGGYVAPGARRVEYAGFWLRFIAFIIDLIIIMIVTMPFRFATMAMLHLPMRPRPEDVSLMVASMLPILMISTAISMVINWLYFAFCESSSWQGTLGKKALGLQVTDLEGNRISFGRATGRFFGKIISGMILLIGYIMAGFTARKQALHDIMAGCLVIKKM
jgi:uncharacterized RDD family membrane protein YckC